MVVIAGGAATGDDDGDWDINSANVGLAVMTQTIVFGVKASVKKRWPPSCGLRPECNDVHQTFLTLAQT